MNRVFTSIILALGLISTAAAQNSSSANQGQDPNEIIVLSSYVDGNYNVEQLLVMESSPSNNEFVMRYKINLTKLISSYDNNSAEIEGLHNFIESIQNDSLKRITHYDVIGYASPDGPTALNQRLADQRAADFCAFVDKECDMSDYTRTVSGKPYMWIDTKAALQSSEVPNKSEVLSIISSTKSQSEIQGELETHTASWDYIKNYILPPMRCVEIHIKYNSWKVIESRTLIEEVVASEPLADMTQATSSQARRERREARSEDDYINCVLVEMPGQDIDFDSCCDTDRQKLKIGKKSLKYKEDSAEYQEKIKIRERRAYSQWWDR
ncbi:MAG: hypothetical protein SNF93_00300 [Rikenellaceae bacterium]